MRKLFIILIIVGFVTSCNLFNNNSGVPTNENPWVNGYLRSGQHDAGTSFNNEGVISTDEIDWDALTHLTYLSLVVDGNGSPRFSLDPFAGNSFNSDRINTIVPAAHQNNVKILFNVRGAENRNSFNAAISDTSREQFISTITDILYSYGFDGVNITMDTLETMNDLNNYRKFINKLSSTFENTSTNNNERPLLTTTVLRQDSLMNFYSSLQHHFDQINIPTYNMSLPSRGWQTWHNSALRNKSATFPNNSQKLPSIHQEVKKARKAGIEREKIGIGINFYGYVWNTVNLGETWRLWPAQDFSIQQQLPYATLSERFNLSSAEWDSEAKVPYLNENNPKRFVSFDNEKSLTQKVRYTKKQHLGGVIIWNLAGGHFQNRATNTDPLLSTIKREVFNINSSTQ